MDNTGHSKELHATLPETIDKDHTQHICAYLQNLRDRIRHTVHQHTELIQTSVNIIKEMGDVSTTLALAQTGPEYQPTKIKRLIMEFESMVTGDSSGSVESIEFHNLLTDFRNLHESQLLRDSLMCFNRAKESFEKIEVMLNESGQKANIELRHVSPQNSQGLIGSQSVSPSLREKIQAFNKASVEQGQNLLKSFTHCFSTISSPDVVASDEQKSALPSRSRTNSGYEGDVDSEIEPVQDHTANEKDVNPS